MNGQRVNFDTKKFIYADDRAAAAQVKTFEKVENKLTRGLGELVTYYGSNKVEANPKKYQVCAFHLRNGQKV